MEIEGLTKEHLQIIYEALMKELKQKQHSLDFKEFQIRVSNDMQCKSDYAISEVMKERLELYDFWKIKEILEKNIEDNER